MKCQNCTALIVYAGEGIWIDGYQKADCPSFELFHTPVTPCESEEAMLIGEVNNP